VIPLAILAGGLATRLRPLTETVPKALLEVAGEPFISHQLRLLHTQGIEHVVLCVGYLGEMIQQVVGDGKKWGLNVSYSSDADKLLGTGGALKQALPLLGERFFVLYGDSYLNGDFAAAARAHELSGKRGLMTVLLNDDKWDRSNVLFRDGQIIRYDKVQRAEMRHIDWGLGILRAEAFDRYGAGDVFDLASVYRQLLDSRQLAGYEVPERFYEIGSADGLRETEEYILRNRQRSEPTSPSS
jgi:N-acetyl-alpha-D-muramate 1-phosphate uridylyltransferase